MHYKNGRVAQVGDLVVGKDYNGAPVSGIVVRTMGASATCNLYVAPCTPVQAMTASECLHFDDVLGVEKAPLPES